MVHHERGAVLWPVFRNLAPGLIIGSFLGAGIADYLFWSGFAVTDWLLCGLGGL